MELYRKHRPRKLEQVVGQDSAVSTLRSLIDREKIPHCLLLTGPSGTGKTTIGRIIKSCLDCSDHDFIEVNAADFKGIDTIRDIREQCGKMPMDGPVKIFLIDECQKMTNDAQNAILKLLEDTPKHVYFQLATTDPHKLLNTILTRSTEIKLRLLSPKSIAEVVERVAEAEGIKLSEDVLDQITECADGSARKALVLLGQIADLDGDEERLSALSVSVASKEQAFALARALHNPQTTWSEVAKILTDIKDKEEVETVRYVVLGYARSVLLKGGKLSSRAYKVIQSFHRNFYDSKHAGLAGSCYEVVMLE